MNVPFAILHDNTGILYSFFDRPDTDYLLPSGVVSEYMSNIGCKGRAPACWDV